MVTNEQEEKRPSMFIKLEDKSKLTILSNLFKIKTHFLKAKNMSVLCNGDKCAVCEQGEKPRTEYFYYGVVDKEEGVIRVPASIFFELNNQERVLEIDKRDSVWVISKEGSGLDTEYSVARGKEAGAPIISVEEANKKLSEKGNSYFKTLQQKYLDYVNGDSLDKEADDSIVQ